MPFDATARRRWLGVLVLLAALGMLIAGETVLSGRLDGLAFLMYWLVCFGFTSLAVLVALWDARVLRRQSRQQERALLETTIKDIETDAQTRPRPSARNGRRR